MRIVYIAYHGSIHTRRWVAFFAGRGHDVHVITCGGGDVVDYTADGAVIGRTWKVHDVGAPVGGKLGYVFKRRAVRQLVHELQPDLVHAHWLTSYGMLALAAGAQPLVVTAHGDDVLIAPQIRWKRWLIRRVLRAARLVTVPSESMRDAVRALLPPRSSTPIEVFQYGVDVGRLADRGDELRRARHALRASQPTQSYPVQIISTRAMLRLYRIDVVIDAIVLLAMDGLNFQCDLVGDGPERATLEAAVADAGLQDRVTFHGHIPPDRVEQLVAQSDIYVSVAESDGMSLSLLEAMSLGAVPVVSDIPANRGWINSGETGVLVEIDPSAVAGGIARALELDPWRVARDNVAVVAERADITTNLTACEQAYDDLIGVLWDPTAADDSGRGGVDAA